MKTRTTMVVIAILAALQLGYAGEPNKKFDTDAKKIAYAIKNLNVALHSDNAGVVESAIRLTAQMKMQYPSTDVTELVKAIDAIWQKNPSGVMRYKAYIAANICANPEWYSSDHAVASADETQFFRAASERMQEKLLSVNTY